MSHTCVQTALSKVRDAVTLLDNAALDMDSPQYSTHPMHSDVVADGWERLLDHIE